MASLDIKLLPKAQGRGIASYALSYVINQVFESKMKKIAELLPENYRGVHK